MKRVPLFIVCGNPACAKVKAVRKPCEHRKQKYCSRSCASTMTAPARREASREACRRVGLARASQLRRALLARLTGLSPLEAFRMGYDRGLQSKWRQMRKHRE